MSHVTINLYPDSIGDSLSDALRFLQQSGLKGLFDGCYLMPTLFNTDLDGGFSVITYDLNRCLATQADMDALHAAGIRVQTDLILNHLSVLSPQFQDLLRHGEHSAYRDFFIDWNRFFAGSGCMGDDGIVHPAPGDFLGMNLRKKGYPVLKVRFPDGRDIPFWNTFYQKILYPRPDAISLMDCTGGQYASAQRLEKRIRDALDAGKTPEEIDFSGFEDAKETVTERLLSQRRYLGQMDVNIQSAKVWEWYGAVMDQLRAYHVCRLRLDAFTRLHKAWRRANFLNEPETWNILERVRGMAEERGMEALPEMHATYASGAWRKISDAGCVTYDYFLPGLILDALITGDGQYLAAWAQAQEEAGARVVNMLGCHDGIPIRDLRGLLPEVRMQGLVEVLEARGLRRKMIHGANAEVYQMDGTYLTALGGDVRKMALARAIQCFMPGEMQVWYLDLLCGTNDEERLQKEPGLDNRELNRTRLDCQHARAMLMTEGAQRQVAILQMHRSHPAFSQEAKVQVECGEKQLRIRRTGAGETLLLEAGLSDGSYRILGEEGTVWLHG